MARVMLLSFTVLSAYVSVVSALYEGMYCGKENCYDGESGYTIFTYYGDSKSLLVWLIYITFCIALL